MDKDIARHVAKEAFRSWEELASVLPWTKEHLDPAEQKEVAKAIARASAQIIFEVQDKMYALYPELKQEYEETLRTYERVI